MPSMPSIESDPPEWTYSGDPSVSHVDEVRFWLQDTDPRVRLMSDLELQFLIDLWMPKYDSLVMVAAVASDRVAAKFTGVVSVSADGVNADVSGLADRYAALGMRLRQLHKDATIGGEVDLSNLMWDAHPDWGIEPLQFGVGMHDSRDVGRQNYGSHRMSNHSYEDTVRPGY